jgi:hypothetical protein
LSMASNVRRHSFTEREPGSEYCKHCEKHYSNPVHIILRSTPVGKFTPNDEDRIVGKVPKW